MENDQMIMDQVSGIQEEIAQTSPLVSVKEEISALSGDFADADEIYKSKLKDLFNRYSNIRRTRGDGNCFFRSFGFACLQAGLTDKKIQTKLEEAGNKTKASLVKLGYSAYTVEDFHDTYNEILSMVSKGASMDEITEILNNPGYSDYFVVFLRLVVSAHLQTNSVFFENFIDGYETVKDFCSIEVEPMSKESDHIHVIALSAAVNLTVQIEYMDRTQDSSGKVNAHRFPDDGSEPALFLLYRPGHYDVLYPKQPTDAGESVGRESSGP